MRQKVLEDSIIAIQHAIENYDLHLVNIFANRLMTDASFLNNELVNIFAMSIKNLIDPCNILQNLSPNQEDTKNQIIKYLIDFLKRSKKIFEEPIEGSISNPIDTYWAEYYNLWNQLIDDTVRLSDYEDHYNSSSDYTHKYIIYMLKNNKQLFEEFCYRSRLSINGIINEIQRLYKNFGFSLNDFVLYNYLIMFERIIDTIIFENMDDIFVLNEKKIDLSKITSSLNDFIEPINNFIEDKSFDLKSINNKIHQIISLWRNNYIKYQNFEKAILPQVVREHRKKIQVPEEVQKKIDELVQKSMYKNKN